MRIDTNTELQMIEIKISIEITGRVRNYPEITGTEIDSATKKWIPEEVIDFEKMTGGGDALGVEAENAIHGW